MKKRILTVCLALLCVCAALPFAVSARASRLWDGADILTDAQEATLLSTLDRISEETDCDIVIATVTSTEGQGAQAYANRYFRNNGFGMGEGGRNAVVLLICMGTEREMAIDANDSGERALRGGKQDDLTDDVADLLTAGRYADACELFADRCYSALLNLAADESGEWRFPVGIIPISIVFGLICGLIGVSIMKGKLRSVSLAQGASCYTRKDSFAVTDESDLFLYATTSRIAKPDDDDKPSSGGNDHTHSSTGKHF